MAIWRDIGKQVSAASGEPFTCGGGRLLGGGCINSAYLIEDGARRFFVKVNQAAKLDMFEAEAEGLGEIASARAIRVPLPVCAGLAEDSAFLVLEHVDFGRGATGSAETLGRQLADMHRAVSSHFGWHRDNTIGATPQINTPSEDWPKFFRDWRLGFQFELAAQKGHRGALQRQGERLLVKIESFFSGYAPRPSLLHGDLWSGNYAYDHSGVPVVFDPAVYYGDRETDLAMTELFGSFPASFYDAYREAFPLDPGYPVRKTLYNLYHILNHLNLFGGGYLGRAESMIARLLGEAG